MSVPAGLGVERREGLGGGRQVRGRGGWGAAGLTPAPTPGRCSGPGELVGREAGFLNEGAGALGRSREEMATQGGAEVPGPLIVTLSQR